MRARATLEPGHPVHFDLGVDLLASGRDIRRLPHDWDGARSLPPAQRSSSESGGPQNMRSVAMQVQPLGERMLVPGL